VSYALLFNDVEFRNKFRDGVRNAAWQYFRKESSTTLNNADREYIKKASTAIPDQQDDEGSSEEDTDSIFSLSVEDLNRETEKNNRMNSALAVGWISNTSVVVQGDIIRAHRPNYDDLGIILAPYTGLY
jgi:hypothetical protein